MFYAGDSGGVSVIRNAAFLFIADRVSTLRIVERQLPSAECPEPVFGRHVVSGH